MKVAIQGEPGSFHELAARHWFDDTIELVCCETFAGVFDALAKKQADAAVCAIENSLYGSINEVYDLLRKHRFPIIGEVHERIHQNLITLPGADLREITHVYSHPVALDQCRTFLEEHLPEAERIQYHDTAASVEYIKRLDDPRNAAIASMAAAELYELPVANTAIEDMSTNYTRFLVMKADATPVEGADKASLILKTDNTPGALYSALGILANSGINMTKLQSRPIIGQVWKYQFYLDVEAAGQKLHDCISEMMNLGCEVSILGEYKAAQASYED